MRGLALGHAPEQPRLGRLRHGVGDAQPIQPDGVLVVTGARDQDQVVAAGGPEAGGEGQTIVVSNYGVAVNGMPFAVATRFDPTFTSTGDDSTGNNAAHACVSAGTFRL